MSREQCVLSALLLEGFHFSNRKQLKSQPKAGPALQDEPLSRFKTFTSLKTTDFR